MVANPNAEPAGELGDLVLEIERVLPGAPEVVFAAFADSQRLAQWWGPEGFTDPGGFGGFWPEGFTVASLDFEPRAGAAYHIQMQPPDADFFHLRGEFREVDPPARLAFTFVWDPPDPDDTETLVELSFRDLGDESTEVRFTQGRFATEARLALHRDGWGDSFDKLERFLSAA